MVEEARMASGEYRFVIDADAMIARFVVIEDGFTVERYSRLS